MRLVDNNEIVVAPVKRGKIDVARVAGLAAEVCVRHNIVPEAVFDERVELAVELVHRPVVAELFRAENKDALVLQLEVLHHGKRLVGLAQADAVRDDAAVMLENLVDRTFGSVLLELKECLPDPRLEEARLTQVRIGLVCVAEEFLEDVEESLVVDKLWGVVLVELLEVAQNVLLDVGHKVVVTPKLIEPLLELLPVAVAIHDQV